MISGGEEHCSQTNQNRGTCQILEQHGLQKVRYTIMEDWESMEVVLSRRGSSGCVAGLQAWAGLQVSEFLSYCSSIFLNVATV